MSKLDELLRELCPHGVEYKKIGKIANYEQPSKYIVESTDYNDAFDVPVLTAGQTFILGYTNESTGIFRASKLNPVIIFDDFTGAFKWVDFSFKVKSSAMKIITASNDVSIRYLFHVMGFLHYSSNEHKRLWIGIYSEFEVPVPPLEIQREIVRILDNFTNLTAELTAELTARKAQYSYYRDKLLTFESRIQLLPLKDIAKFSYGYTDKAQEHGDTRFLRITDIAEDGTMKPEGAKYILLNDESKKYLVKKGDLLLARTGATYGKTLYVPDNSPAVYASFLIKIELDNSKISNRYYWHFSKSNQYWRQAEKLVSKGGQQQFNTNAVERVVVPVPPLDVQNRIVNVLDNFEKICSDLNIGLPAEIEARQKQYEYYRDKLLTFKEVAAT
jgi:type I restriction modification DNA specificity domain protein